MPEITSITHSVSDEVAQPPFVLLLTGFGRIEAKVDGIGAALQNQDARLSAVEKIIVPRVEVTQMGQRITNLETARATDKGFIKAVALIGGPIVAGVTTAVNVAARYFLHIH